MSSSSSCDCKHTHTNIKDYHYHQFDRGEDEIIKSESENADENSNSNSIQCIGSSSSKLSNLEKSFSEIDATRRLATDIDLDRIECSNSEKMRMRM